MIDPIAEKLLPLIMKTVFNAVSVDDFIQYDSKNGRLIVGDGMGGFRPLSADQSQEYIDAAKECSTNLFFQSFLKQLRYKGQETMAASANWDAAVFPKGILYAADLLERLVATVNGLHVAPPQKKKK